MWHVYMAEFSIPTENSVQSTARPPRLKLNQEWVGILEYEVDMVVEISNYARRIVLSFFCVFVISTVL